ncbi:MAG: DNA-binding protein [Proteobacteria bacterium]|nr:DNA-binding protein [Pseudomonadota bacterium]
MGRTGITEYNVEKAILEIQAKGKEPTIEAIRMVLGTGSNSTIAEHLKNWKKQQEEKSGYAGKVPSELIFIVQGLWEKLHSAAELRITNTENDCLNKIQSIEQQFSEEQKQSALLQKNLLRLEEQLYTQNQINSSLKEELAQLTLEKTKFTERNQSLQAQFENSELEKERLHVLLKQVQANLEHYQESSQKAREELLLSMENQRTSYEQEILQTKQSLIEATENHRQLQHQLEKQSLEFNHVSKQSEIFSGENEKLRQETQQKVITLTILQEKISSLTESDSHQKNQIQEQAIKLVALEKQNAVLENQAQQFTSSIKQAEDKIRFLENEKSELTQEKIILVSQLKKIQDNLDKMKTET